MGGEGGLCFDLSDDITSYMEIFLPERGGTDAGVPCLQTHKAASCLPPMGSNMPPPPPPPHVCPWVARHARTRGQNKPKVEFWKGEGWKEGGRAAHASASLLLLSPPPSWV